MIMKISFALLFLTVYVHNCYAQLSFSISSPDKNILVICDPGKTSYTISYKGQSVLKDSKLGVIREDEDFSKDLKVIKASAPAIVKDNYTMINAKKRNITYVATQRIIETQSP